MGKTVAIITMHRVFNYGSILQTVALSNYLKANGYNPLVIDYQFPNEYHHSVASRKAVEPTISWLRQHINGLCYRFINPDGNHKINGFNDYINQLSLTKSYNSEEELRKSPVEADIYLTGSDQVWNPRYVGKDLSFLLSWVSENHDGLKVSYGASFGAKWLDEEHISYIEPFLKDYDALSVREDNDILPKIGLKNNVVLDPTFLLNREEWGDSIDTSPIVKCKYILCYLIGYSFNPFPYADRVIRHIKKRTGYKVVMIAGEPLNILKGYKLINDCTPSEFINLFYNASYVITSSFHGTAFAINFGVPFTTIVNDESDTDNRQESLIKSVGLGNQGVLKKGTPMEQIPIMEKGMVAPDIEQRRKESQTFLLNALKSKK